MKELDREIWGEAAEEGVPVFEHTARAYDEGLGFWVSLGQQAQQAHDLVGLAEPHVVGQEGADPHQVAAPQPRDAVRLVGPELRPETGWMGDFARRPALEHGGELAELLVGAFHRESGLSDQADKGDPAAEQAEVAAPAGDLEAEAFEGLELGRPDDRSHRCG